MLSNKDRFAVRAGDDSSEVASKLNFQERRHLLHAERHQSLVSCFRLFCGGVTGGMTGVIFHHSMGMGRDVVSTLYTSAAVTIVGMAAFFISKKIADKWL
jgi:hypothetical protein